MIDPALFAGAETFTNQMDSQGLCLRSVSAAGALDLQCSAWVDSRAIPLLVPMAALNRPT